MLEPPVFPDDRGSFEEQPGQLLVAQLGAAADVVDLAGAALRACEVDAVAVVVDGRPVANVAPVAGEGFEAVEEHGTD
ncbi:hypothetical protein M878_04175 [Streptomyces roseochromogenus subsp. oscitans DS 12.976]|uniref:Uncharacterized protein n=1 Tax=Streptomyces roseochromogenus subsp. oscitans DS 12.976 TaxID=1352936 RepID=V6KV22_STRRC|nr:hypothetical protein M878_04175 [Streptomyces roseochromogenus subsp. oscitans DS 12.976]